MNPEVKGFLQLAVDENHLTQEVTSFDSGMTQATVLSFETCPEGGAPPPPPGPPPPPPPCKAKLDMVVILDGSAVHSAISNLQQMRLNTNTYAGFSQAKSIIDSQGRTGTAGKLVLIVTD